MRVFFPDGAGKWKFSCVKSNGREHNYGGSGKDATCEAPNGTQPASGPGGKVYILFQNQGVRADKSLGGGVVYCYDPAKTVYGQTPEPDWYCPVKGDCAQSGMGVALGEDGTVYAATQKTGSVAAHVTAISAQGVKRWEHAADGDINGVPAVDDQGFVYYNDRTTGKLVKLRPEDGSRVAEIKLADELRSSPTISYDGTILTTFLGQDTVDVPEGMTIYDYVQGELDSYGLTQLEQLGFENTYAIGVPQALADEYGLETISDLIPIADQLTFGAEQEFFTLEGSMKYDPFVKFYGLNFQDAVSVDMGLKYSAIENGSFDVAVVYSTDGLNKKVGLKVLEDDQSFFPDYNGVFLVRDDLLEKYPEVADILNQLAGKIPTEQMAELTYQVDVEGRTVDEVAREFLVSLGLLEA